MFPSVGRQSLSLKMFLLLIPLLLLLLGQLLKPSELLPKARQPILSHNPVCLGKVIPRNIATTLLMIERHRPQAVEFSTQLLYHNLQLRVLLAQPAPLLLNCLSLLTLS
jgi:hypothetical protein